MASRKKPRILSSLYQYIHGIFDYFYDKGMPMHTAKAKTMNEAFYICTDICIKEKEIPDHLLVVHLENTRTHLQKRGSQIAKKLSRIKHQEETKEEIELLRKALRDIKSLIDQINAFISIYRGEADGRYTETSK